MLLAQRKPTRDKTEISSSRFCMRPKSLDVRELSNRVAECRSKIIDAYAQPTLALS